MITTQTDANPFGGFTLVKYDTLGQALWNRNYPQGIIGNFYGSFTVDSLGYAYVGVCFDGGLPGYDADAVMIKYAPDGAKLWEANYGISQSGDSYIYYADLDTIGRLIAFGVNLSDTSVDDNFLFVSAIDTATGMEIWKTKIPGVFNPQNMRVHASHIQLLSTRFKPDNVYYVITQVDLDGHVLEQHEKPYTGYLIDFNYISKSGNVFLGNRAFDYRLTKLNTLGDTLWSYALPNLNGSNRSWIRGITEDDSLNVYCTGAAQIPGFDADFITTKLSATGNYVWEKTYHTEPEEVTDSGEKIFVGENKVFSIGGSKLSSDTTILVLNIYNATSGAELYQILIKKDYTTIGEAIIYKDQKIYFSGVYHNNTPTGVNIITGSYRLPKMISSTQEKEDAVQVRVYPNPTIQVVHITNLDASLFKRVYVTDARGACVMQRDITDDHLDISVRTLPAGVYFIQLKGEHISLVKKIIKVQ